MQNVIKVLYFISSILVVFGMVTLSSIEIVEDVEVMYYFDIYFPLLMCFIIGACGLYLAYNFIEYASKFYANFWAIVKNMCITVSNDRKYRKLKYSFTFTERFDILHDEYLDNFYRQYCY